jgi:carbon-monoxide dehydrogenase large subunit
VLNAVNDALRPTGVELDSTPLSRADLFAALNREAP